MLGDRERSSNDIFGKKVLDLLSWFGPIRVFLLVRLAGQVGCSWIHIFYCTFGFGMIVLFRFFNRYLQESYCFVVVVL